MEQAIDLLLGVVAVSLISLKTNENCPKAIKERYKNSAFSVCKDAAIFVKPLASLIAA